MITGLGTLRGKAIQKTPYIALAIYLGFFPLPIPVAISIVPLLLASLALSLAPNEPTPDAISTVGRNRLMIVLAFAVCYAVTVIFSQNQAISLQVSALFLPGLLVLFLVYSLSHQPPARLALIRGTTLCIAVVSSLYLFSYLNNPQAHSAEVLAGLGSYALVVPNDLAIGIILTPFLILGLSVERKPWVRFCYWLTLLLFSIVLAISGSRLCLAGAALLVVLILGVNRRHLALAPLILLLGLLILSAVDLATNTGVMHKLTHLVQYNGRLSVWFVGLTQWTAEPWLGVGPGGFEAVYQQALFNELIPTWMQVDRRMVTWAHSLAVEALLERGVLGLLALSILGYAVFTELLQRTTKGAYDFHRAAFMSFVMFAVMGALELTLQRNWVVILLCLYIGLYLTNCSTARVQGEQDSDTNDA